jgi:hypothetical protein
MPNPISFIGNLIKKHPLTAGPATILGAKSGFNRILQPGRVLEELDNTNIRQENTNEHLELISSKQITLTQDERNNARKVLNRKSFPIKFPWQQQPVAPKVSARAFEVENGGKTYRFYQANGQTIAVSSRKQGEAPNTETYLARINPRTGKYEYQALSIRGLLGFKNRSFIQAHEGLQDEFRVHMQAGSRALRELPDNIYRPSNSSQIVPLTPESPGGKIIKPPGSRPSEPEKRIRRANPISWTESPDGKTTVTIATPSWLERVGIRYSIQETIDPTTGNTVAIVKQKLPWAETWGKVGIDPNTGKGSFVVGGNIDITEYPVIGPLFKRLTNFNQANTNRLTGGNSPSQPTRSLKPPPPQISSSPKDGVKPDSQSSSNVKPSGVIEAEIVDKDPWDSP